MVGKAGWESSPEDDWIPGYGLFYDTHGVLGSYFTFLFSLQHMSVNQKVLSLDNEAEEM